MSIRRISSVLFSVILVAVSVLAVQLLLFAQEGRYRCTPANILHGGESWTEPSPNNPNHTVYFTDEVTMCMANGKCNVYDPNNSAGCTELTKSPGFYIKTVAVTKDQDGNQVGDPKTAENFTDTYIDCYDGC